MSPRYPAELLYHATSPEHAGVLEGALIGQAANHNCGDDLTCCVRIEGDVIAEASHSGVGCALSTASMDWLCSTVVGRSIEVVVLTSESAVAERWGLVLSPMRSRCAARSVQALKAALATYVRT